MLAMLLILLIAICATGWMSFYLQERISDAQQQVIERQKAVQEKLQAAFTTIKVQLWKCHQGAQEMVGLNKQLIANLDNATAVNARLRERVNELEELNSTDPADYWKKEETEE